MKNETLKFVVVCDNKASFQVSLVDANSFRAVPGKPVLLIRTDRLDLEDNERGMKLANKLADFLNTLPQAEIRDLVQDEAMPPLNIC